MKFIIALCIVVSSLSMQKIFAQDEGGSAKSALQLTAAEKDSVRQIKATITQTDVNGTVSTVKDIEVHFFAKKSFGLLPLGDAVSTDEQGVASVDFPKDLPGDSLGNVTVIAKVEDNPKTGELEANKVVSWGIPVINGHMNQRALWASAANAPWPLVITSTAIVVGVWGVIFYIIILLFKIKKSGKYETI